MQAPRLPVDGILDELRAALASGGSAVLVAPPGAGKTTRVPPALLGEVWLAGRKIILLEPRRLAARTAAEHMARQRGEELGQTVGLRARLVSRTGPATRIEVVTEGVFTRLVLDNPGLDGIGAVVFDEFHERSLDADFGLALALDVQAGLRPDLRLVIMSATLDAEPVAALLGGARVTVSEGRAFPVETRYLGRDLHKRLDEAVAQAIHRALSVDAGSVLAFLPGQGEIRRVAARLQSAELGPGIDVVELHGGLDQALQSRAIAPSTFGRRKVVLATSIAETSITIEGVRIVIDSGLQRVPRYEPDIGLSRLETVRVSQASADQRRGRAGRTQPGVCYRLWSEAETAGLLPFTAPEIRAADLSGVVLDCAAWGVIDPLQLRWLDTPPQGAWAGARADLVELGALDSDGRITPDGHRMRALPLPPRLARMLLRAADMGAEQSAAEIAAVLVERNLGGRDIDLLSRLSNFRRERSERARAMRRLAANWARQARSGADTTSEAASAPPSPAELLALAYPDRLAKGRGGNGRFLLANGRGARLESSEPLAGASYLAVAELTGAAADARIVLAAELSETQLDRIAGEKITERDELAFDKDAAALRVRRVRNLGAIVLSSKPGSISASAESAAILARGIGQLGVRRLPWTKAQLQIRDRVAFLRASTGDHDTWPDLSDSALEQGVEEWLTPFLTGRARLADIRADDLAAALDALVRWDLRRRLDLDAPTHFEAPTGRQHPIDYTSEGGPSVAVRVQELYGLMRHPTIAGGRPLTLQLLSPAGRPIQITRDLPGFWRGSWSDVRSEMRGRYPKHDWPQDPATARPTVRAKGSRQGPVDAG